MVRTVENQEEGGSDQIITGDDFRLGQVFTIGTTGENRDFVMENISISVKKVGSPPNPLSLELWTASGLPLLPIEKIATAEILETDVSTSYTWQKSSDWNRKKTTREDEVLAISAYTEGADGANYYMIEYDTSGEYTGGSQVRSTDGGANWSDDVGDDMSFRIFGSQWDSISAEYAIIIDKGGKEADADITDVESVNGFAKNAEATLNSRARYDFTGNWDNLQETFKGIISEQVENVAATRIINFDISSYTERLIAKLMVDTLTEEYERVLNDLKDDQVQKAMVNGRS